MPSCLDVDFTRFDFRPSAATTDSDLGKFLNAIIHSDQFKLWFGLSFLCVWFFNNFYYAFLILYEKHRSDSAKRSLKDEILLQFWYVQAVSNITLPCLAWRVFFGPFNPTLAELISGVANFISVWSLLCLNEVAIIRTVSLFRSVIFMIFSRKLESD